MQKQDYLVALAAFFLAAGTGFLGHQIAGDGGEFARDVDVRVDNNNSEGTIQFDNKKLGLTYENFKEAKFYYNFNDSREDQEIEGLTYNGEVQTFRDIKSFGKDTYFLYFRYQDNASKFGDGWMELYRIEKQ